MTGTLHRASHRTNFRTRDAAWAALVAAALAAAMGGLAIQLAFAVVAIGVVGMAHGASDLAVVPPVRRPGFLALYGIVSVVCLLWWTLDPAIAAPAFLLLSALHFGVEDAPAERPVERCARGIALVAAPAALHQAGFAAILQLAGVEPRLLTVLVPSMAAAGAVAAAFLLVLAVRGRDLRLLAGTAALLALPPLVGFSVGFLVLHAVPQTVMRRKNMGLASSAAYLRTVWPVLGAAIVLAAAVSAALLRWDPSGVRSLFAGIAALAVPHLLVTPWFEAGGSRGSAATARSGTAAVPLIQTA